MSVDLTYNGFEVTFSTESIKWKNLAALQVDPNAKAAADEDRRVFEIMPAPANATLRRYVKDLAHVRAESTALPAPEKTDPPTAPLWTDVEEEQRAVKSWMRRVCEAAGGLSIADPAFSPRK
jgi:hypothetical protein